MQALEKTAHWEAEQKRAKLVEKVSQAIYDRMVELHNEFNSYDLAEVVAPLVRAEVLEEAALEVEKMEKVFAPQQVITDRCAAAIRALKDR